MRENNRNRRHTRLGAHRLSWFWDWLSTYGLVCLRRIVDVFMPYIGIYWLLMIEDPWCQDNIEDVQMYGVGIKSTIDAREHHDGCRSVARIREQLHKWRVTTSRKAEWGLNGIITLLMEQNGGALWKQIETTQRVCMSVIFLVVSYVLCIFSWHKYRPNTKISATSIRVTYYSKWCLRALLSQFGKQVKQKQPKRCQK